MNKPSGPSSAHCLGAFKRQGQRKIGHAGTLDPLASGVLPVLLGQATKLSAFLLSSGRKIYSGSIRLGLETDTWDITGQILAEGDLAGISAEATALEIEGWTALEQQEVPAYSAAKHKGQPLYKLARKGQHTPVKVKKVQIFEAAMLEFALPEVRFRVSCSSGVYIRSLAHSLGRRLGCGAALSELAREYSQPFGLERAAGLEEIRLGLRPEHVLPMQLALPDWPLLELTEAQAALARDGRAIKVDGPVCGHAFLCLGQRPIAIARAGDGGQWLIERGLWNQ